MSLLTDTETLRTTSNGNAGQPIDRWLQDRQFVRPHLKLERVVDEALEAYALDPARARAAIRMAGLMAGTVIGRLRRDQLLELAVRIQGLEPQTPHAD